MLIYKKSNNAQDIKINTNHKRGYINDIVDDDSHYVMSGNVDKIADEGSEGVLKRRFLLPIQLKMLYEAFVTTRYVMFKVRNRKLV